MKHFLLLTFMTMLIGVTACKNQSAESPKVDLNDLVLEEEVNGTRTAEPAKSEEVFQNTRKLIKTGTLTFESDDLPASAKLIKKLVAEVNGYVSSDQTTAYHHRTDQTMTLRIPSDKFDTLIDQITLHAKKTESKNMSVQDVSEEFVDVAARLTAKKEIEKRYIQILSKAAKVDDILKIESELGSIRTEIESIEGRLKYLQNQTSMSTIHVTFYQTKQFVSETPFFSKLKYAISDGWNMVVSFTLGLIQFWPFIIILSLILFYFRRRYKS
jgi:hypothetical protein